MKFEETVSGKNPEMFCENCEHGLDNSGYCLDCYYRNKFVELKRKTSDDK